MMNVVDLGYNIFVWPRSIEHKDINLCILNNISMKDMREIVKSNTFNGSVAKIKIQMWKNGER